APEVPEEVAADVVEKARLLRELPLRKAPSISEVVDAARAAAVWDGAGEQLAGVRAAALLKYRSDVEEAREALGGAAGPVGGAVRQGAAGGARHVRAAADSTGVSTATAFGAGRAHGAPGVRRSGAPGVRRGLR